MKLILGDCLEKLKDLEDESVDSVVTDAPYELGFMGKGWDNTGIANNVEMWKQVLRILKPGGHLLSFGGTRTYHRMACAIEDAGFEIRDCIMWIYGSGFPKSFNIGKAVDKLQGNERNVLGDNPNHRDNQLKSNTQYAKPCTSDGKITKGNSPYEGYGTALKPAVEPIVLARKPLKEKTVAENVLKYGTGGINIDGCRVGKENISIHGYMGQGIYGVGGKASYTTKENGGATPPTYTEQSGRFPANVIHDGSDEVVGMFPNDSARLLV